MATRVGIALGANLGQRLTNIRVARDMLRGLVDPESLYLQAPIYQSQPVDCASDAPDFYNTVIEIDYIGEPYDLLQMTQGVEFSLGRDAVYEQNAPRVIDVDILYFGSNVIGEDILTIPHPRMLARRFVLQPLNDIRPNLILPGDIATISEHHRYLDSDEPPLSLVQSVW
ncbi:2-amino-4-hydroxy-6-hydroxymethyldihydropteridine diphosphokinase [Rubritalea profundi]|uniref:2-amino-4-hydroxy-6-hydroxymethyldihydropteridine pyrophosphokinase n=1 Tax=Rubritalea profundi TaxID=1658618 RepID=A0A2S7TXV8_9BACT|nr:2-amino-4-hydroxy-6-hydroxymethyldihydropteridine diphosphokinase [Rubritalea profundi]PQJ27595.1 2-amino-4-hydroxy-6-hydroxymethyldihydropteridine diphosphokinase [Rubritalea profundi]